MSQCACFSRVPIMSSYVIMINIHPKTSYYITMMYNIILKKHDSISPQKTYIYTYIIWAVYSFDHLE